METGHHDSRSAWWMRGLRRAAVRSLVIGALLVALQPLLALRVTPDTWRRCRMSDGSRALVSASWGSARIVFESAIAAKTLERAPPLTRRAIGRWMLECDTSASRNSYRDSSGKPREAVGGGYGPRPGGSEFSTHLATHPTTIMVTVAGWPAYAFEADERLAAELTTHGGVSIASVADGVEPRTIPFAPRWKGLAANLATFSGLAFALITAGLLVAPLLRRRRGRCERCGHAVQASAHAWCPECGLGGR